MSEPAPIVFLDSTECNGETIGPPKSRWIDGVIADAVRRSVAKTIHRSKRSVDEIAIGLSKRLGLPITKHVLRSMSADSQRGHRFPLEWTAAWIAETGDDSLARILMTALGLPMPREGDGEKIRLAEAMEASALARNKLAAARTALRTKLATPAIEADLAAQQAEGLKARILRRN